MRKRTILILLVVIIIATLIQVPEFTAFAATQQEVATKLEQISKETGFRDGEKGVTNGCWAFVNSLSDKVFNVAIPGGTCAVSNGLYQLSRVSANWYRVDYKNGTNATKENVISLLKKAYPGDIIQYQSLVHKKKNGGSFADCVGSHPHHTAMVANVNRNGLEIYDSSSSGIKLKYYSWNDFVDSKAGGFDTKVNTNGLSLYRFKNYDAISFTSTSGTNSGKSTPPTSAPTNFKANGYTTTNGATAAFSIMEGSNVSLAWKEVDGATKYKIEPLNWNGSKWVVNESYVKTTSKVTSFTYMNLPKKRYGFRITAGNTSGWSTKSATWFAVDIKAPKIDNQDINVEKITLSKTSITIDVGQVETLSATVSPNNATNKTITWASSNSDIATVFSNGMITGGTKPGKATITATSHNGVKATCTVTVVDNTPATPNPTATPTPKPTATPKPVTSNYKITSEQTKTDPLNVRSSASTSGSILGTLSYGDVVTVTEVSGTWGKITFNGKTGWISLNYATKTTEAPYIAPSAPKGVAYKITGEATKKSPLNIRSAPNTSSTILGTVSYGTTVTVTETSGTWGKITHNGKTGWISLNYATKVTK